LSDNNTNTVDQETVEESSHAQLVVSRLRRQPALAERPERESIGKEPKIHPCWKNFSEQLVEIGLLEKGIKGESCTKTGEVCVSSMKREDSTVWGPEWVEFSSSTS
jgi:hypothetical protein